MDYLPANTSGKALNDNYFRPLAGLGALTYERLLGELQLQLSAGVRAAQHDPAPVLWPGIHLVQDHDALTDGYPTTASPYFTDKFRNYGPSYQPTPHVMAVNYIYDVPNLGAEVAISSRWAG